MTAPSGANLLEDMEAEDRRNLVEREVREKASVDEQQQARHHPTRIKASQTCPRGRS